MDKSERLYAAILQRDFKAADNMIASGASLDGDIKDALVKGPSSAQNFVITRYNYYKQYMDFAAHASVKDFAAVTEKLYELVGEPLYNNFGELRYSLRYRDRFYEPEFFGALLKFCDSKKMRKQDIMKTIIDRGSIELLTMCAESGWLKLPRIRDAIIKYSEDNNQTECTAFLLEFKNRNFDLAAEREKAEKRMERELNASPTSISEMKKIWRFKKLTDGTLEITSYKGRQTEVVVPEKIGKDIVSAIGDGAFSGEPWTASRTPREICDFRRDSVTKITLPETITAIGKSAFAYCSRLKEVNIPFGVKEIKESAFFSTHIKTLELPESVECIRNNAFWGCLIRSIKLPQSLTEICTDAFAYSWLESIERPGGVKVIPKSGFWHCANLEEVILHDGVEEIRCAFIDCQALEKINLPASIKKIANFKRNGVMVNPFPDSKNLTAIVEKGSYSEKYCAKNNIAFKYKEEV